MSVDLDREFVDTNILVYAHDVSAGTKHVQAKELIVGLWHSRKGCLSVQVLQEFYVTVVQKVATPVSPAMASQILAGLAQWRLHTPGIDDVIHAIEIHQRHRVSFWDALIICSAKRLSCRVLWTEDLKDGELYDGVQVRNPFRVSRAGEYSRQAKSLIVQ